MAERRRVAVSEDAGGTPDHDLFVSYAGADRAWVRGYLFDALDQAGVRYLDEDSLALGAPTLAELERAILRSRRCLLVVSRAYLADGYARVVELLAQTYGVETSTWPVIPLRLEPVELPLRLAWLIGLDARGPDEWGDAIERLCAELRRPLPGATPPPACPYPGMSPFREDDEERFFGREQEQEELLARLRLDQFVAVIGPSGCGKSSLVQAGLIPALKRGRAGRWITRVLRPGEAPATALAAALGGRPAQPIGAATRLLAEHGPDARLLVAVDQFEELFTIADDQRTAFQAALLSLVEVPGCHVVVTMRADFYPELMATLLWPMVQERRLEVVPLHGEALRQAIVRPAERVGVYVEPTLVERLLSEAAGAPGVLPLVQETLVMLWERVERRLLPLRAYEALVLPAAAYGQPPRSGLQVAISRRADSAMARLPGPQRAVARRILLRLVQFGEGREDVRRQQPVANLRGGTEAPGQFDEVLRHLVAWRLITVSGEPDAPDSRVDLCHEALITAWPTFRSWLAGRRTAEETRRRLQEQATAWRRRGRGERGLLDDLEVAEAERWLASPDALEVGVDDEIRELVEQSRAVLERHAREQEEARRRELAQAHALATAQANRARVFRLALAAVTAATVLAVVLAALATVERRRADNEARLSRSRQLALQSELLADARLDLALLLARQAHRVSPTPAAHSSLLRALRSHPQMRLVLHGHTDPVNTVAFSPDGRTVAGGGENHLVLLWDAATGRQLGEPLRGHTGAVRGVAFSPDGSMLASASVDRSVILWDPRTGRQLGQPLRGHDGVVRSVAFSRDGRMLASASVDHTVVVWDPRTGRQLGQPLRGHTDWVNSVAFGAGGLLATAGGEADEIAAVPDGTGKDLRILLWDARTGRRVGRPLRGHLDAVRTMAFSPDGRTLASAGHDQRVLLWDVRSGRRIGRLEGYPSRIFGVAFGPGGRILATADREHRVVLWDVRRRRRVGVLTGHRESARGVAFAPDGTLASASNDRTVILWQVDRGQRLGQALPAGLGGVRSLAVSRDGRLLAAGGLGRPDIVLWDLATRSRHGRPLSGHTQMVAGLAFSPDGGTLASASWDGSVILWDLAGGRPLRPPLTGHRAAVTCVAFSDDGRLLATGSADGTVRIWDAASGTPVGEPLVGHTNWVSSVAFRPGGTGIASADLDGIVMLWRPDGPEYRGDPLNVMATGFPSLAVSPDGKRLATGSVDHIVQLWDLAAPRPVRGPVTLTGHDSRVLQVAFSRDGDRLVSGDTAGAVHLWDTEGSPDQPIGPLPGHAGPVWGVAFSPDGALAVSGGEDDMVMLWDLRVDTWTAAACRIANRDLSPKEWTRYVDAGAPYRRTCPDLPPADDAWT